MLSKLGSAAAAAPAPPSIPGAACAAEERPESHGAAALAPLRMHPQGHAAPSRSAGARRLLIRQDLCKARLPAWVPGLRPGERARCPQRRCLRKPLCPVVWPGLLELTWVQCGHPNFELWEHPRSHRCSHPRQVAAAGADPLPQTPSSSRSASLGQCWGLPMALGPLSPLRSPPCFSEHAKRSRSRRLGVSPSPRRCPFCGWI